ASARYHDLHVAQLRVLGAHYPDLALYADRFAAYGQSILSRLRAAAAMARAKVEGHYPRAEAGNRTNRSPSALNASGGASRNDSPEDAQETGVEAGLHERQEADGTSGVERKRPTRDQ